MNNDELKKSIKNLIIESNNNLIRDLENLIDSRNIDDGFLSNSERLELKKLIEESMDT